MAEALAADAPVREIFVDFEDDSHGEVVAAAVERGTAVIEVSRPVMAALSDTVTPQGVVAVVERPQAGLSLVDEADLVVVLAGVSDPGNAGALLRAGAAAGASVVVFTERSVDPYNSKTVRASAGTIFRVPVVSGPGFEETAGRLSSAGLVIIGAGAQGRPADRVDLTRRVALVLGNEARGLSPDQTDLLDEVAGIPMPGPVESLNVSTAGAILLFEAVRQRRGAS